MTTIHSRLNAAIDRPWLPTLVIILLLGGLATLYLWPSAWEFPLDDTYIHFVYAQNLAKHCQLMFNTPGEVGVGSTSLTWVVLLAGAYRLGISFHVAAKALGLLSLICAGIGLYRLFLPLLRPLPALTLALLVTASGHMLWFALSGMETMLFFALGVLALLLYRERRWTLLGLVLGLLALTRPDGLALAAAVGLVEIWRVRRLFWPLSSAPARLWRSPELRGLILALVLCLVVCGPWFAYLLWRPGSVLPTSALGKQVSSLIGIRMVIAASPPLAFLEKLTPLIYFGTWVGYLLEFALGGMAFPGPGIPIAASVGNVQYSISLLGVLGWVLVILPLLVSFGKRLARFWRSPNHLLHEYRPLLLLTAWLILHNLAYAFFLPIPGTASRYGTANHLALWLALLLGLLVWLRRPAARPWTQWGLTFGLLLIASINTLYWNRVYDANLEHMHKVRIAAAQYVTEQIPAGEAIAVFDVGVMRFYTGRPIIDLGGLIDPRLGEVYKTDGRIDRYLAEQGARWVILPGRTGTTEEGWFDFARSMGLTDSPLFQIQQVRGFEIDPQRWLLGYLPTNNYQATVTIYHLSPMEGLPWPYP
jgi:hypothetical protein